MYSGFFLVPFLFYNLLCFFSVISLLFSKGCWLCLLCMCELNSLCTDLAPWALCVLCMLPVWCDPWPTSQGALQAQRFACGSGLRKRITQQTLGSAATRLGAPADGSGVTAPCPGSISLCPQASLTTGADLIIGVCQGCVLGGVWGPSAQQMYSSVSCKII